MIFPLICTLSFVYTQEENTYKLHFSKVKTAEFLHFSKVKIAIILHFSKILHVFGNEYPEPKGTPQRETCVRGTPRRGNEHIAQGEALGYALVGPSARSLNAYQLQVNTCEY